MLLGGYDVSLRHLLGERFRSLRLRLVFYGSYLSLCLLLQVRDRGRYELFRNLHLERLKHLLQSSLHIHVYSGVLRFAKYVEQRDCVIPAVLYSVETRRVRLYLYLVSRYRVTKRFLVHFPVSFLSAFLEYHVVGRVFKRAVEYLVRNPLHSFLEMLPHFVYDGIRLEEFDADSRGGIRERLLVLLVGSVDRERCALYLPLEIVLLAEIFRGNGTHRNFRKVLQGSRNVFRSNDYSSRPALQVPRIYAAVRRPYPGSVQGRVYVLRSGILLEIEFLLQAYYRLDESRGEMRVRILESLDGLHRILRYLLETYDDQVVYCGNPVKPFVFRSFLGEISAIVFQRKRVLVDRRHVVSFLYSGDSPYFSLVSFRIGREFRHFGKAFQLVHVEIPALLFLKRGKPHSVYYGDISWHVVKEDVPGIDVHVRPLHDVYRRIFPVYLLGYLSIFSFRPGNFVLVLDFRVCVSIFQHRLCPHPATRAKVLAVEKMGKVVLHRHRHGTQFLVAFAFFLRSCRKEPVGRIEFVGAQRNYPFRISGNYARKDLVDDLVGLVDLELSRPFAGFRELERRKLLVNVEHPVPVIGRQPY